MQTQNGTVYLTLANRIGQQLAVITDFSALDYAKTVNQVGALTVDLPVSYRPKIKYLHQITVYRQPFGGRVYQEFNTVWFIMTYEIHIDPNGMKFLRVICACPNFILRDTAVAYYTGSAQASQTGLAGDMMKQVVRDNLGDTANDWSTTANVTSGSLPPRGTRAAYLGIDANTGDGASIAHDFSWQTVLTALSDMAQMSYSQHSYIAFDLVSDAPGHLQFRTFAGQRGRDRRWKSGSLMAPVILDPLLGNLSGAVLSYDYQNHANYIYAAGQGTEAGRLIGTAYDANSINLSPYGRREKVVSAKSSRILTTTSQVAAMGLQDSQLQILFSGAVSQTQNSLYGVHYFWADLVTCQFESSRVDCYLDTAHVTVTPSSKNGASGFEKIDIQLRSLRN